MDADLGEVMDGFGGRLEAAIRQSGLTIAALARDSMVSRWTIMNWVNEETRPEMGKLRRVARVLGVTAEDLLGSQPDDGAIDSVDKFFAWKAQEQFQEAINLRRAIESEVQRRLAEELTRLRPSPEAVARAAATVIEQVRATSGRRKASPPAQADSES